MTGLLGAALALALAALVPASAAARTARADAPLGVITAVSQTGTTVTTASFFIGTEATGFVLAVPHEARLSSLSPARIARDISLSTIDGAKVHYVLLGAKANYLSIALHAPQPDLRLTFTSALFTFSAAETRRIHSHTLTRVRMGIAFSGGPGQLVASKFKITV
jgi:hypothetical protein